MRHFWWLSQYDWACHAFPAERVARAEQEFFEAECGHSVPINRLVRKRSTDWCWRCLHLVGYQLPDAAHRYS